MDEKLIKVLEGMKYDLQKAYTAYSKSQKDDYIKTAAGKVDVLIELLRK